VRRWNWKLSVFCGLPVYSFEENVLFYVRSSGLAGAKTLMGVPVEQSNQ